MCPLCARRFYLEAHLVDPPIARPHGAQVGELREIILVLYGEK